MYRRRVRVFLPAVFALVIGGPFSLVVGVAAMLFVQFGLGSQVDKIIIGAVMPLVPGLLITNAARDLIAGHLVSGLSKGADAGLTALAIGTGIAVAFVFL